MKRFTMTALAIGASLAAFTAAPAVAQDVLTFEGIPDETPVGDFYAPKYFFSPATLALVDADAGGNGNFANEPSPNTIMFFTDADNAILNAPMGFDTGFSFYYTSSVATTINVWSGLDASGTLLASLVLDAQYNENCTGDPSGDFCNFTAVGVTFDGIAQSIDFAGAAGFTGFDNITFGSSTPGGGVPEPATWGLMILGFGAVGSAMRRRSTKVAFA